MIAALLSRILLPTGEPVATEVRVIPEPIPVVKKSPIKFPPDNLSYEFPYETDGYVKIDGKEERRFRVFSQDPRTHTELSEKVAKFMLRLWRINYEEFQLDHKPDYSRRLVDVYLCKQGVPGGEHCFDNDLQTPKGLTTKVNTIYIYDLPSFTEPVEMLRELAHEYGHATLPAIGGYKEPEDWANGFLGERLFMARLLPELSQDDPYFGSKPVPLKSWVNENCRNLALIGAKGAGSENFLQGSSAQAMDRYLGTMLWLQMILPPKVLGRVMKLLPEYKAPSLITSAPSSVYGAGPFTFTIPDGLKGSAVWVPFGEFSIRGAKVLRKRVGWSLIQPTSDTVTATQQF